MHFLSWHEVLLYICIGPEEYMPGQWVLGPQGCAHTVYYELATFYNSFIFACGAERRPANHSEVCDHLGPQSHREIGERKLV